MFVRSLRLPNVLAWREYAKSGKRPDDIPSNPQKTYAGKGWQNMVHWLGNGKISTARGGCISAEAAAVLPPARLPQGLLINHGGVLEPANTLRDPAPDDAQRFTGGGLADQLAAMPGPQPAHRYEHVPPPSDCEPAGWQDVVYEIQRQGATHWWDTEALAGLASGSSRTPRQVPPPSLQHGADDGNSSPAPHHALNAIPSISPRIDTPSGNNIQTGPQPRRVSFHRPVVVPRRLPPPSVNHTTVPDVPGEVAQFIQDDDEERNAEEHFILGGDEEHTMDYSADMMMMSGVEVLPPGLPSYVEMQTQSNARHERAVQFDSLSKLPVVDVEAVRQVEIRLTNWIRTRVERGEPVYLRQVRNSFHKQHRAAGGTPQGLGMAIHEALVLTGATVTQGPMPANCKRKPGSRLPRAPTSPAGIRAVEEQMVTWAADKVTRGLPVTSKKVRDKFHVQHKDAGGTPEQLAQALKDVMAAIAALSSSEHGSSPLALNDTQRQDETSGQGEQGRTQQAAQEATAGEQEQGQIQQVPERTRASKGRLPPARPFAEALTFARALGLKGQRAWTQWCASGARPADIRSNPQKTYAGKGWQGWSHWLGNGVVTPSVCTTGSALMERSRADLRTWQPPSGLPAAAVIVMPVGSVVASRKSAFSVDKSTADETRDSRGKGGRAYSTDHRQAVESVSLQALKQKMDLPIAEAAKYFGIPLRCFQRVVCRKHGIQRWPFRHKRKKQAAAFPVQEEFVVERILAEREAKSGGNEYLVEWAGYDTDENSWEPEESIEDTAALDDWLEQQKDNQCLVERTNGLQQPARAREEKRDRTNKLKRKRVSENEDGGSTSDKGQ